MELNRNGFSVKRTKDIVEETVNVILDDNCYVSRVVSNDNYITVNFKIPVLVEGKERTDKIIIAINETDPVKKDVFVPVYKTVQVDLCTINEIEYTRELSPDEFLYPYLNGKLIHAKSVLYSFYNFGVYYDEGGTERLREIAESINTDIKKLVSEYYLPYVEERINKFKSTLR